MAKSIRSKWKRKMRAIKREGCAKKELERLKKTVGENNVKKEVDVIMTDIAHIVTVTDTKIPASSSKNELNHQPIEIKDKEKINNEPIVHKYNKKTMKDQFGSYPVWMHQRKIAKNKKSRKGKPKRK